MLSQHYLLVPNGPTSLPLDRAFVDVSVLEEGKLHNRQGELSARRKTGGILP